MPVVSPVEGGQSLTGRAGDGTGTATVGGRSHTGRPAARFADAPQDDRAAHTRFQHGLGAVLPLM